MRLSTLLAVVGALLCWGRAWAAEPSCQQRLATIEQIDREAAADTKTDHAAAACRRLVAAGRELMKIQAENACQSDFQFKDFPSDSESYLSAAIHESVMAIPCRRHGCEDMKDSFKDIPEHVVDFMTPADYAFYKTACDVTKTTNAKKTPHL